MLRLVWYVIFLAISLIRALPVKRRVLALRNAGKEEEAARLVDETVRGWAETILKKGGVNVRTAGLENLRSGPVVFVSNHEGDFDIPAIIAHIAPASFVAKREMRKVPLLRDWMDFMGCLYVDRKKTRQKGESVVDQAIGLLKKGKPVIIFPEGTRSRGAGLGKFKSGAFRMAIGAGAPIIPVRIEGASRLFEQNRGALKKGDVTLTVFPPIPTDGMTESDRAALTERVRSVIAGETE